ncbi:sensor histidine kinase [Nocardiopsis suaedae]|uniref:sensor histidine kinase n=1 Tax=Nocardiopsis suaedae TaxID=3018444 RepID=UPI0038CD4758
MPPVTEAPPAPRPRAFVLADDGLDRLGLRTSFSRDCALAVAMAAVSTGLLWVFSGVLESREGVRLPPSATALLALLVYGQSLMLCLRRMRPVLCVGVVAFTHVGVMALMPPHVTAQGLAPFIAAYTCGAHLPARRAVRVVATVTAATALAGTLVAGRLLEALIGDRAVPVAFPRTAEGLPVLAAGLLAVAVAMYGASAFVGYVVAIRRDYTELVRVRAAEAVQRQEEKAANAVMAERARMARELHDIAAHHLSGMVVQAGAAERLVGRDDQAAREAVSWIRTQGKETLDGLRLAVGALRDPGEEAPSEAGAPVPGADAVERLVRAERALGARVGFAVEGERRELPPVADVTVYRVAQEALANARDHAPGARVDVLLHYTGARVVVQVENAEPEPRGRCRGPGGPQGAPRGLGLIGMRERAQVVGGVLEAGPPPGGGWRVRLEVPR